MRALFATLLCLGLAACGGPRAAGETLLAGESMGSAWTVKVAGALPMPASRLREQIQARFEAVDAALSTWRPDSALSQFNDHPGEDWQALNPELARVLGYALELAAQSDGAYDVTLAPVVDLWGFGPGPRRGDAPEREQIEAALRHVGWRRISFDAAGQRARKPAEARVDLSSLGKGRGVDRVAAYLLSQGMEDFLIDLSGKLRANGRNARGEPWRVGVEMPGADDPSGEARTVEQPLELRDEAIATAGTYRRYFLADGRQYSHLIDARTGEPVAHATRSATAVAADALQADALATVLALLPPQEALAFADARGLAALLVLERNGQFQTQPSLAWGQRGTATGPQGQEGS